MLTAHEPGVPSGVFRHLRPSPPRNHGEPIDYRKLMSEAITAELQPRLPKHTSAKAMWGYIYVFVEPPGRYCQLTAIFWPDGVSIADGVNIVPGIIYVPRGYFYYCDPAFPEDLIQHLLQCTQRVLTAMSVDAPQA